MTITDAKTQGRESSLSATLSAIIACPRCKQSLADVGSLDCDVCALSFPIVGGVPILINEEASIFALDDYISQTPAVQDSWLKQAAKTALPSITLNIGSDENYRRLVSSLKSEGMARPRVLVIGGANEGRGFGDDELWADIDLIETDVAFGPRTNAVCDAHDLPFTDGSFDAVVSQAVLEHVLDPYRCVAEIERVLKPNGFVYAETPFMQQVHLGKLDFLRFSALGHRRLFNGFSETSAGPVCGAGTALAWAYCYFLMSLFTGRNMQRVAFAFGSLTGFFLKYFDLILRDKPGSFDAASAYYFLGRKTEVRVSDREIVDGYRGMLQ